MAIDCVQAFSKFSQNRGIVVKIVGRAENLGLGCGVGYRQSFKRPDARGISETEASMANKLSRGTFAATFFLATLAALEVEGVRLEDI